MPFKRKAAGPAVKAKAAPVVDDAPIHMLKENRTKSGEAPRVVVACGLDGPPYRGPGGDGLRTSVWRTVVTCPACMVAPGVATAVAVVVGPDSPDDD